ncbi:MAG TPA: plastocyanin/azurin family copper-binding protein [Ktedonobacteraceae bacterium]|nr:plastocyanin/azurin family copper-binding protein [Ktedonobacteraceae bacterium]
MSQTIKEKPEVLTGALEDVVESTPRSKGRPGRRRYTVFEKTVMITTSLRILVLATALLAFMFNKATPSPDVPVVATLSIIVVLLFSTKLRWAPVVAIPLAAYILYNTFTEPFLLFDLANPKGPNGGQGFALFIADVLALASTLIVMVCCIGAIIQNYRPRSFQKPGVPRLYSFGMYLITGLTVGAIFIGAMAQPPTASGVATTNGVPTVHMGAAGFNQPSVTISKGSKLLLVDDSSIEHDILNGTWQNGNPADTQEAGAPVVNIALKGDSATVGPFNTAGTYHLYCTVHQGMNLTIVVQ